MRHNKFVDALETGRTPHAVRDADSCYANWALDGGTQGPECVVLERPPGNLLRELHAAAPQVFTRVVCGFLPDEVDWPACGIVPPLDDFLRRFEFTPFVLPLPAEGLMAESVLCVVDRMDDASGGAFEELAEAVANAWRLPVARCSASMARADELSGAIARAAIVINAVSDWSLGFAVDELAARLGRWSMRLANPGYSPFRYALLGQSLMAHRTDEIARLRPFLGRVFRPGAVRDRVDTAPWFSAPGRIDRWRQWSAPGAFQRFWAGCDWQAVGLKPGRWRSQWLDGPWAWTMLMATAEDARFPRDGWTRAVATGTEWLAADLRARHGGRLREEALPRWVRFHPEWLAQFRQVSGGSTEMISEANDWARRALAWKEASTPVEPLIDAARGAWSEDPSDAAAAAIYEAWRSDWARIVALQEVQPRVARPLPPAWRAACGEVVAARIQALSQPASLDERKIASFLIGRGDVWLDSLGAAGPILRVLVAARLDMPGPACAAWRDGLRLSGCETLNGIGRLLRSTFAEWSSFATWLQSATRTEPEKLLFLLAGLLHHWFRGRLWDVWRRNVPSAVAREVRAAGSMIRSAIVAGRTDPQTHYLSCVLAAFEGDVRASSAALTAYGGRTPDLPGVAALALWLRQRPEGATEILRDWPARTDDDAPTVFLRAVALQLVGDPVAAAEMLRRLNQIRPEYLQERGPTDARWAWAAAVFLRAGEEQRAAAMAALAYQVTPGASGFLDDIEPGRDRLAEGWFALSGR